jgi:hypothetical protein
MFEINFKWLLASRYVVRPVGRSPHRDLAIYPAEGATITSHRPLEQNPALYAEFADLDGSKQACLEFANKYGLLQADLAHSADNPGAVETLSVWKARITQVKEIIHRCELSRADPAEAFRRFGKKDASLFGADFYLSIKNRNSPATLEVRASCLFAAIELQAVTSVLEGRKSVQCIECSGRFQVGSGARRSQSKFCSTRCKDAYHNRIKAQARRTNHA